MQFQDEACAGCTLSTCAKASSAKLLLPRLISEYGIICYLIRNMVSLNNKLILGDIMLGFLVTAINRIDNAISSIARALEFIILDDVEEYRQMPAPPNTPTPIDLLLMHKASNGDAQAFYSLFQEIVSQKSHQSFEIFDPNDSIQTLLSHIKNHDANMVISLHQLWHFTCNAYPEGVANAKIIQTLFSIETTIKNIISTLDINNIHSLEEYDDKKDLVAYIDSRKTHLEKEDIKQIVMDSHDLHELNLDQEFYVIGKDDVPQDP